MWHRGFRPGFALLTALALIATPALAERPSAGRSAPGMVTGTYPFQDGARTRTYRSHRPTGLAQDNPAPLALIFHGRSEDKIAIIDMPVITAEADRLGFVLATARGIGAEGGDENCNSFTFRGLATGLDAQGQPICSGAETNVTYRSCGPEGEGEAKNVYSWNHCQADDTGLVSAMISDIGAKACTDLDRVFIAGTSNDGKYTWDMGQTPEVARDMRATASLGGMPHRGYLDGRGRADGLQVLLITGTEDPTSPPGDWGDQASTTTKDADLYHYTWAAAITGVWAKARGCEGEPAKVDFGADTYECRSACTEDGSVLPAELYCRAPMAYQYDLDRSWPMIMEFFARQPAR